MPFLDPLHVLGVAPRLHHHLWRARGGDAAHRRRCSSRRAAHAAGATGAAAAARATSDAATADGTATIRPGLWSKRGGSHGPHGGHGTSDDDVRNDTRPGRRHAAQHVAPSRIHRLPMRRQAKPRRRRPEHGQQEQGQRHGACMPTCPTPTLSCHPEGPHLCVFVRAAHALMDISQACRPCAMTRSAL